MGTYSIDLNTGDYQVVTALAGFQSQTAADESPPDPDGVSVTAGWIKTQNVQVLKLSTIAVAVTAVDGPDADSNPEPAPVGTTVILSPSPISVTRAGDVWTFVVAPGVGYRADVAAPGFSPQTLPAPPGAAATPQVGQNFPQINALLAPRTVTVNVNGASPPAGTTVIAKFGAFTRTLSAPNVGTSYVFSSASWPEMPLSGDGLVVVDAGATHRAVSTSIADAATQTIPITLSPLASVTGTILPPSPLTAIPAGTNVVTATAAGKDPIAVNVTAGATGSYTIDGLDVGTDASGNPMPLEWTITYDAFGVGTKSTTVVVSSNAVTPTSPAAMTPTPTQIPVRFRVSSADVSGEVTVNFNSLNRAVTPDADGELTPLPAVTIPETAHLTGGIAYTVTGAGYQNHPGGIVTPASRTAIEVPVTVRKPIIGTVTSQPPPAGGNPVAGATVRICPSTAVAMSATPAAGADVLTAGGGNAGEFKIFDFITANPYTVWATKTTGSNTVSGSTTLTFNANGSYTLGSTITVVPVP